MTAYAVTDYVSSPMSHDAAIAALETKLETLADTQTIRLIDIKRIGNDWVAVLIYDDV